MENEDQQTEQNTPAPVENVQIELLPRYTEGVVSKEFVAALPILTGSTFLCMCGRQHHVLDDIELPAETKEQVRQVAERAPEAIYIYPSGTVLEAAVLNDENFILSCPCNEIARYESYLWGVRKEASAYYAARAARQLAEAQADAVALKVERASEVPTTRKPRRMPGG
jgi:hypothetical protein